MRRLTLPLVVGLSAATFLSLLPLHADGVDARVRDAEARRIAANVAKLPELVWKHPCEKMKGSIEPAMM